MPVAQTNVPHSVWLRYFDDCTSGSVLVGMADKTGVVDLRVLDVSAYIFSYAVNSKSDLPILQTCNVIFLPRSACGGFYSSCAQIRHRRHVCDISFDNQNLTVVVTDTHPSFQACQNAACYFDTDNFARFCQQEFVTDRLS